jgi:hypothetical protein
MAPQLFIIIDNLFLQIQILIAESIRLAVMEHLCDK